VYVVSSSNLSIVGSYTSFPKFGIIFVFVSRTSLAPNYSDVSIFDAKFRRDQGFSLNEELNRGTPFVAITCKRARPAKILHIKPRILP